MLPSELIRHYRAFLERPLTPMTGRGPVAPSSGLRSARQWIRAGRGHELLGYPVVDVMEPVVERASINLDGCSQ